MSLAKYLTVLVLTAGLMGAPAPNEVQTVAADDEFTLDLSGGIPIDRFLEDYAEITGQRVLWDSRRLSSRVIAGTGDMTFRRSQAEKVFGTILSMHDMACLPHGDPELGFVLVEDIKTSQTLKQRAKHVEISELPQINPSRVVSVVVPLKQVPAERAQRVLNNFIQEHRAGFVSVLEEANTLVITNYVTTVRTFVSVLEDLEAAAMTDEAKAFRALREAERAAREK